MVQTENRLRADTLKRKRADASVSVYMALSFVLIFTLIIAMLEASESAVSVKYAEMSLAAAAGSMEGEYYGPLFGKYGIFAIDAGFGESTRDIAALQKKLKGYVTEEYAGLSLSTLSVDETEPLLEPELRSFITQASDHRSQELIMKGAEELLKRVEILKDEAETAKVFKKIVETERLLSVTDEYIASLMRTVDGVEVNAGIALSGAKPYSTCESFLKSFFVGEPTMENVGINNPAVYSELKEHYHDPAEYLAAIAHEALDCSRLIAEQNRLASLMSETNDEINKSITRIRELEAENPEKTENNGKAEENSAEINLLKVHLIALEEDVREQTLRYVDMQDKLTGLKRGIESKAMFLETLRESAENYALRSLDTVRRAKEKTEELKPMVEACETLLKQVAEGLKASRKEGGESDGEKPAYDITEVFSDTMELMKSYVGLGSKNARYDFGEMADTLEYDLEIFKKPEGECALWKDSEEFEELVCSGMLAGRAFELAADYETVTYGAFVFDYSSLQNISLSRITTEAVEQTFAAGVLAFLLGEGAELSHARLSSELLPSAFMAEMRAEGETEESFLQGVFGSEETGIGRRLADIVCGIERAEEIIAEDKLAETAEQLIKESIETMSEQYLMADYCANEFKAYGENVNKGDSVLQYEKEYIIVGKKSDEENLAAVAGKILTLRLLPSALLIFTDPAISAEAEAIAAVVGCGTGLPLLHTAIKYVLLAALTAEQAAIETAAIMKGRKVPIMTDRSSLSVSIASLAAFNSAVISAKAATICESAAYIDYDEYLFMFLLAGEERSQVIRALDVIQENLRYEYDGDILLANFITSFSVSAEYERGVRYFTIPHLALTEENISGYRISAEHKVEY